MHQSGPAKTRRGGPTSFVYAGVYLPCEGMKESLLARNVGPRGPGI